MPSVDEKLLAKLVSKFGVDKEPQQTARSRLWGRVVKEYNTITDNNVSRQKIVKKWQNISYQKKLRTEKLLESLNNATTLSDTAKKDNPDLESGNDKSTSSSNSQFESISTLSSQRENLWTVCDHVLRDLFLYLVKKYNFEDITHPRQKSEMWTQLCLEFHEKIGHCVTIRQERFTKKWQNWKAYNKSKNLSHPFETHKEVLDFDVIKSKLYKLQEMVAGDKLFAQRLSREGDPGGGLKADSYDIQINNSTNCDIPEDENRSKIRESSQRNGSAIDDASVDISSHSVGIGSKDKKLEREVMLRKLKYEIDRRKLLFENSELESNKLKLETELVKLQIEQTKADIALRYHELKQRGISLDTTSLTS